MRAHMWRRPQKWVRDGKWGTKLGLLCQVGEIKRLSLWLSQILRVLNSNYKMRRQNSLRKYEQARHMHVDPWSPLLILFIQSSYNFAPSVSFFYYKDLIIAAVASTDDDTLFKIRSERQRLFSYRQTIALYFFLHVCCYRSRIAYLFQSICHPLIDIASPLYPYPYPHYNIHGLIKYTHTRCVCCSLIQYKFISLFQFFSIFFFLRRE